ncbi:protein trichome birefringence-like 13 [Carex littledalei]|uniref:Protein trichome birefringence-like 13 n=1 Tax=Carex littledalei TaxID=544730 RepID=A0A833QGS3_9POAL|nr:protein trichome birefringence-like 13 [Carex littledalei]
MALKLTQDPAISPSLFLFPSSCSSYTHSPLTSPLGHRIHHHHSCVTPLRATIPRANGFATRVRSSPGTTRDVRRYTKVGIALPMGNPAHRICSAGGGNRPDAISLSPTRFPSWSDIEIQILQFRKSGSFGIYSRERMDLKFNPSNLLVQELGLFSVWYKLGIWSATSDSGALKSLGYKQGYRIDVDVPDQKWAEAPKFHHILVFNTGHWWWAPSKFDPVQSPMLFFQNGTPVIPPLTQPLGMELALKHMLMYIENLVGPEKLLLFRTQSPRHFEGGDWNAGGSCRRDQPLSIDEVGELLSVERNGTNVESRLVNQHLFEALKGSRFHILDITSMSVFRADAHPSTTGGKKHEDCMHWCLPGLPDIWNDLFVATLETLQIK